MYMQAVILAAGRGTRMGDLTVVVPKPMLEVAGKNLLEHKLESLPAEVDEIIFVVSGKGTLIEKHFGHEYKGRAIRYAIQNPLNGTAGALWAAQSLLRGPFLIMAGDDLYSPETFAQAIAHPWSVMTALFSIRGRKINAIVPNDAGNLDHIAFDLEIKDTPAHIDALLYHLDTDIFNYEPVSIPGSSEFGLPHTVAVAARDIPIRVLTADFWLQLNTPEDLEKAKAIIK